MKCCIMKQIIISCMVALTFVACNQEELINETTDIDGKIRVVATLPSDDSRVASEEVIDENGNNYIKVRWKDYDPSFPEFFQVITESSNTSTCFYQTPEENVFEGELPEGSGPYYAFYDGMTMESSGISVKGLWCYIQNTGNLHDIYPLMYAVSNNGKNFKFNHLAAIVKFTLKGIEGFPHRVKINGLSDYKLISKIDLTTNPPTFNSDEVDNLFDHIDINVNNIIHNSDGSCTFYFYFPPVNSQKPLDIEVKSIVGEFEYTYNVNVEFKQKIKPGKFYRAERTLTEDTSKRKSLNRTAENYDELWEWLEDAKRCPYVNLTLTDNIDCEEERENSRNFFTSDLTWGAYYQGTLNGAGYTIKGLKKPLIHTISSEGIIKDLNIDVNIDSDGGSIGAFIDNRGRIENCNVYGSLKSTIPYEISIGGLTASNYGTIINCTNSAIITSDNGGYIGGIAGGNSGNIVACINSASISSTSGSIGGITGENSGNIVACINSASISSASGSIGGIVGYNYAIINSCYSIGSVLSESSGHRGGIAGISGR